MANPLVSIQCLVYNHEKYLRQCLDGFVMQKTDFAFEAIVHDDASTDGSAAIIREYAEKYPDIIIPIYETENRYSKHDGSLRRVVETAMSLSSKYIALCEGDDYWIDPIKLQRQVDFLETHPDCTLCGTNGLVIYQDGLGRPSYFNKFFHTGLLKPEDIIGKWAFPTASIMFRKEVRTNYPEWASKIYSGDQLLMLIALSKGSIYVVEGLTCVYRKDINGSSVSRIKDKEFLFVENQHLKLYRYYYDYVNDAQLKTVTKSYILQLEKHIEQREKNKTFNELYRKSLIRPFFWNFSFSCKKYKELIRYYCIHKLTTENEIINHNH